MQTDYQYNMGNLAYTDIQEYLKKKDIVMVPIASLEQHSYHCPLFQTRPGYRSANTPETAYSVIGLRVVGEALIGDIP